MRSNNHHCHGNATVRSLHIIELYVAETEELETNSKINNVRDLYGGIKDFKKGYQPRTIIVKDEKGDLIADSHSIMAR
jgi:ribosomal protein S2